MQRQHSSQATSTLGNTPNLNIGFLHQKENPTLVPNVDARRKLHFKPSQKFLSDIPGVLQIGLTYFVCSFRRSLKMNIADFCFCTVLKTNAWLWS